MPNAGGDDMAITDWEIRRSTAGQNNINVILCDDDPGFLKSLQDEIERTFFQAEYGA